MYIFAVHLFSFLRHLFLPFRADSSNEAPVANGLTEFGEVSEFQPYCFCVKSYANVYLQGHCLYGRMKIPICFVRNIGIMCRVEKMRGSPARKLIVAALSVVLLH